jgi:recombinational DNA repair protein (RecF pathway)
MVECCCTASGAPSQNSELFQLTVNLLRSEPREDELFSCCAVFALKLLALLGLRPDLTHCAIDGHELRADEPSFLLPSGEGLIGRDAFNENYARSGAALLRVDSARRLRWLSLLHGPLLDYVRAQADESDAALLLDLATRHLADLSQRPLDSAAFLRKQWKLPSERDMLQR